MPDKQQIESDFLHVLQEFIHRPDSHPIAPNPVGVDREFLNFLYALIDIRINLQKETPKLKTLEEHNAAIYKSYKRYSSDTPQPNGIECPRCKKELLDSDPSSQLLSNPPQKATQCSECDYRGYRLT